MALVVVAAAAVVVGSKPDPNPPAAALKASLPPMAKLPNCSLRLSSC